MHNTDTDAQLIGTAEAARLLGVDPSTVNRWCQLNKLTPAAKLDGLRGPRLFHRNDIDRLALELKAAS